VTWVEYLPDDTPLSMSPAQWEYWKHKHLTVDMVPGGGNGFSVEAP